MYIGDRYSGSWWNFLLIWLAFYSSYFISLVSSSSTFHISGTLNPALQDRFGRPKRDISTIIHILNDLLCATPQYRRHARQGHTITLEASSGSPAKSGTSGGSNLVSVDSRTGHTVDFMGECLFSSFPSSGYMLHCCCNVLGHRI